MGLSGKLLGAGIGYFLGGPLGAAIGAVLGHFIKDAPPAAIEPDPRVVQQQEELYFVASLVGIVTAMLRADGEVRPEEVQAVRRFFSDRLGYRGESLEIVRRLIRHFLETGTDLDALCRDFVRRADPAVRLLLMECLEEIALADGKIHPAEEAVLRDVAARLGVSSAGVGSLKAGKGARDFEILGVLPSASPDQIKKAYRELAKKHHPDLVAHLGEELRALSHEKFLEIQGAYERIRAAQGF